VAAGIFRESSTDTQAAAIHNTFHILWTFLLEEISQHNVTQHFNPDPTKIAQLLEKVAQTVAVLKQL
jgi:hypothetical protein